ncbi:MAG: hypothetical protein WBR17_37085 [Paraburkholderia sp.]|uniref:hypothetical protein n=1 Tax=Paraburkholderia sp. TaxID=1926495 RepID=UPI003C56E82E
MAKDIEPVEAGKASSAGRLCNFVTGQYKLLPSHTKWLDEKVIPLVRNSPNPWVDVFGYASRLGDAQFNKRLSDQRCEAVVQYIKAAVPRVSFPQEFGFGESKSSGGVNDNDGFWRSVELYVYAMGRPPEPRPRPITPEITDEWFVTEFAGHTESLVVMLGYSVMTGNITFRRADSLQYRGAIGLVGLSLGLSLDIGKLPGMATILQRFPALLQWLGGGAPLADEMLKKVMQPSILQRIIALTPGGMQIFNALKDLLAGGSVSLPDWAPSWLQETPAIGMVFPFAPPLTTLSFYGSCMCYGLTGTVLLGNFGTYLLFFGYRGNMYSTDFSLSRFKGCAIIAAGGAQLQIPGLAATGTLYAGEIT